MHLVLAISVHTRALHKCLWLSALAPFWMQQRAWLAGTWATLQVTGSPRPQELSQPMTVRSWWVNSLASLAPGWDNSETCPTQSPRYLSRIEPQMPTAVSGHHMEYMWVYGSCDWCACECVAVVLVGIYGSCIRKRTMCLLRTCVTDLIIAQQIFSLLPLPLWAEYASHL